MAMDRVTVELDADVARIYQAAPVEDQKKVQLLLSLCLRAFATPAVPLYAVMDEVSDRAQARGLTPEILETLLHAN